MRVQRLAECTNLHTECSTGDIPLDTGIREGSDRGHPVVAAQPDSTITAAYLTIAERVLKRLPALDDPLAPR